MVPYRFDNLSGYLYSSLPDPLEWPFQAKYIAFRIFGVVMKRYRWPWFIGPLATYHCRANRQVFRLAYIGGVGVGEATRELVFATFVEPLHATAPQVVKILLRAL